MKKTNFLLSIITMAFFGACGGDEDNPAPGNPPVGGGEKITITTSDMSFSPSELDVKVGDHITFVIGEGHTATRVDESTWYANETTWNEGFNFSEGTHTYAVQPSDVGLIYYVCVAHVAMSMKGVIRVAEAPDDTE